MADRRARFPRDYLVSAPPLAAAVQNQLDAEAIGADDEADEHEEVAEEPDREADPVSANNRTLPEQGEDAAPPTAPMTVTRSSSATSPAR